MKHIFVFGSNLAGRHGAGAARHAKIYHGAVQGIGEGLTGSSYALPTKDCELKTRTTLEIKNSIDKFAEFARNNQQYLFELTPIGLGLAGLQPHVIVGLLKDVGLPSNVLLSQYWLDYVK